MSEDFLSTCASLPAILSFLEYDDLVRCMQLDRTIYSCINGNWSSMNRKKCFLFIDSGGNLAFNPYYKYLLSIGIALTSRKTVNYRFSNIVFDSISIALSETEYAKTIPYFLKQHLQKNFQQDIDKSNFVHTDYLGAVSRILNVLLPRVEITHVRLVHQIRGFELGELTTIANSIQQHYIPRTGTVVPYLSDELFRPILIDIAKGLGALKVELDIRVEDDGNYDSVSQRINFNELNMKDIEIKLVHYDWLVDEIAQLLEIWKAGELSIMSLKIGGGCRPNEWDLLCSELKVHAVSGMHLIRQCNSRFELSRDSDFKKLEVTYFEDGEHLEIKEQL